MVAEAAGRASGGPRPGREGRGGGGVWVGVGGGGGVGGGVGVGWGGGEGFGGWGGFAGVGLVCLGCLVLGVFFAFAALFAEHGVGRGFGRVCVGLVK